MSELSPNSDQRCWYIAIVPNNTERASANKLQNHFEVYLPTQQYLSIWKDGRRKVRERILLPGKLLIHCTEAERQLSMQYSCIKRYMVDIASAPNSFGRHRVAVIPDAEVDRLRFILSQSEVTVTIDNKNLQPGERVRIVRGSLQGLEAEVTDWSPVVKTTNGAASVVTKIQVRISHLGFAKIQMSPDDLERISI